MTSEVAQETASPDERRLVTRRSLWSWFWTVAIPISAIAAGVAVAQAAPEPIRAPVILWFIAICPGMAIVRHLKLDQPIIETALGVALSLALATLIPAVFLYLGAWSPPWTLAVLLAIAGFGSLLDLAIMARGVNLALQRRSTPDTGEARNVASPLRADGVPDRMGTFARQLGAPPREDAADPALHVAVDRVVGDLAEQPRRSE